MLTGARAMALTVLIGWELGLTPRLFDAAGLGQLGQLLNGAFALIELHPSLTRLRTWRCRSPWSSS
jgi:hypothetical protein